MSSDRVCQFFLRGRCHRVNCEFKHVSPTDETTKTTITTTTATTPTTTIDNRAICRFFQGNGNCRFGDSCRFRHVGNTQRTLAPPPVPPPLPLDKGVDSDDESVMRKGGDTDDESIASGFTEFPIAKKSSRVNPVSKDEGVVEEEKKGGQEEEETKEIEDQDVENPSNETPLNDKSLEERVQNPVRDSIEPDEGGDGAQPPSDAIEPDNSMDKEEKSNEDKSEEKDKEEEEEEDKEKNNETKQQAPLVKRNDNDKIMETRSSIASKESSKQINEGKKKTVADLSKEWDDDDEEEGEGDGEGEGEGEGKGEGEGGGRGGDTAAAAASAEKKDNENVKDSAKPEEESIENIENFIQEDSSSSPTKDTGPKDNKETNEQEREENDKSKDEWVTLIFGEDDKTALKEKSVYDLNPEGDDFAGNNETTSYGKKRGRAKVRGGMGRGGGGLSRIKKEGVTKIGNNVYFYTGPKGSENDSQDEGGGDEEDEDMEEDDDEGVHDGYGYDDGGEVEESVGITDVGDQTAEWDEMIEEYEEDSKKQVKKVRTHKKRTHSTNYVYAAKASAAKTRRCGECENCNKEDCNKCDACKDKPRNGGKGLKKQACIHRVCLWKNPSGKSSYAPKGTRRSRTRKEPDNNEDRKKDEQTNEEIPESAKSEITQENGKKSVGEDEKKGRGRRGRMSLPVIAPGTTNEKKQTLDRSSMPDDSSLPKFDPDKFKPGYKPPVVKKGDSEYVVVVTGVKDTGLCGKYWSDTDNLPSRRRTRVSEEAGSDSTLTMVKSKSNKRSAMGGGASPSTPISEPRTRRSSKQESTPMPDTTPTSQPASNKRKNSKSPNKDEEFVTPPPPSKRTKTASLSSNDNNDPSLSRSSKAEDIDDRMSEASVAVVHNDFEEKKKNSSTPTASSSSPTTEPLCRSRRVSNSSPVTMTTTSTSSAAAAAATTSCSASNNTLDPKNAVHSRSVSCVADTSTQREVVVECFAPYDDHRWVNIGKERDNMAPDAVQYARALRPPYHLLSFLRIKGHSTKGMSCTDKNTMVFVVLEGEITVVLHTTQFNAKKGDSFYIPPKNYYNLINQKAREAELSLIQFQYDGPLPTVAANSQSGNNRSSTRTSMN